MRRLRKLLMQSRQKCCGELRSTKVLLSTRYCARLPGLPSSDLELEVSSSEHSAGKNGQFLLTTYIKYTVKFILVCTTPLARLSMMLRNSGNRIVGPVTEWVKFTIPSTLRNASSMQGLKGLSFLSSHFASKG